MKTITDEMRKQWSKWMGYLYDYLPTKYEAAPRDWAIRRFVWNFKEGKQSMEAACLVATKIKERFGTECHEITFICIPASSKEKNEMRYKAFAAEVCRLTGCRNGFEAVEVEGERLAVHEWRHGKGIRPTQTVRFDGNFFNGHKVLVFDDIITNGHSYAHFACKLEAFGALVIGGLFLARTINF